MTPLALQDTLQALIVQKQPAFVWGAPGIGKSSIIKQIAEQKEIGFIDLRLTLLDPTDLKGIPFLQEHQAVWATPSFLPRPDAVGGILFLDELNSAPPSVQAAAYQLILDRKVGEYTLPDNWAIIAAGNRENDRGVTHKMPTPLANRFVHFEMELSYEDWRVWAFDRGIDAKIISFLGLRPDALFIFDPTSSEKAFPTPRSWEFVNNILKSSVKEAHLLEAVRGAVGEATAVEFLSYCKDQDAIPVIEAVFEGRSTHYPQTAQALHVTASLLVYYALAHQDKTSLNHMLRYTLELAPEFAILIVRDLQAQGVRLDRLEAWKTWSEKFSYLMV